MSGATLSGTSTEIGALLGEAAAPGDVLASSTVRDLVAGSGLQFEPRGQTALGPKLGVWEMFGVVG
jgi:class 3 adenylate cyclase